MWVVSGFPSLDYRMNSHCDELLYFPRLGLVWLCQVLTTLLPIRLHVSSIMLTPCSNNSQYTKFISWQKIPMIYRNYAMSILTWCLFPAIAFFLTWQLWNQNLCDVVIHTTTQYCCGWWGNRCFGECPSLSVLESWCAHLSTTAAADESGLFCGYSCRASAIATVGTVLCRCR